MGVPVAVGMADLAGTSLSMIEPNTASDLRTRIVSYACMRAQRKKGTGIEELESVCQCDDVQSIWQKEIDERSETPTYFARRA